MSHLESIWAGRYLSRFVVQMVHAARQDVTEKD